MTAPRKPRVGLALGSGSARGWAHIGVIRALEQAGIRPDYVCGTSIGALVGAAYATGELDRFEQWVLGLGIKEVVGFMDVGLGGGLFKGERLMGFFRDHFADRPIEQLAMPFAAVATSLHNGAEIWLRRGSTLDAVRASIAVPGFSRRCCTTEWCWWTAGSSTPCPCRWRARWAPTFSSRWTSVRMSWVVTCAPSFHPRRRRAPSAIGYASCRINWSRHVPGIRRTIRRCHPCSTCSPPASTSCKCGFRAAAWPASRPTSSWPRAWPTFVCSTFTGPRKPLRKAAAQCVASRKTLPSSIMKHREPDGVVMTTSDPTAIVGRFDRAPVAQVTDDDHLDRMPTDQDLDRLQWTTVLYYLHETNPDNGLVRDKTDPAAPCSIAAVGLALATIPVIVERGVVIRKFAAKIARRRLRSLLDLPQGPEPDAAGYKGFFYHFLDIETGRRVWDCELSTLDSACPVRWRAHLRHLLRRRHGRRGRSPLAWPTPSTAGPTGTGRGTAARRSRTAGGRGPASSPTATRATTRGCSFTCSAWARRRTRCPRRVTPPTARPTSGSSFTAGSCSIPGRCSPTSSRTCGSTSAASVTPSCATTAATTSRTAGRPPSCSRRTRSTTRCSSPATGSTAGGLRRATAPAG